MKKITQLCLSLSSLMLASFTAQQIISADELNENVMNKESVVTDEKIAVFHEKKKAVYDSQTTNTTDSIDNQDVYIEQTQNKSKVNESESEAIVVEASDNEKKQVILDDKLSPKKQDTEIIVYSDIINEPTDAVIIFGQYSIDTKPWGEKGFKKIGETSEYINQTVNIIAESSQGYYKLAELNGQRLGWIDHRAFGRMDSTVVARIGRGSYSVDTQPWGTTGYQKIDQTDNLLGQQVKVVEQHQNKYYSYVLINDKPYGWVDNRALIPSEEIYNSWIIHPNFSIDNSPWNEKKAENRGFSNSYVNQRVKILGVNKSKTYYLVADQYGKTIGWIDYRALSNVNFTGQIIRGEQYSIDTRPWGSPGFKQVGLTRYYLYENVQIIGTAKNAQYMLAVKDNTILGWIDYRALSSRKGIKATINKSGFSIDTKPWGTLGYKTQTTSQNLIGNLVEILGSTKDNLYHLVRYNNGKMGWIDSRALRSNSTSRTLSSAEQQSFDFLRKKFDYNNLSFEELINQFLTYKGVNKKQIAISYIDLQTQLKKEINETKLFYGASTYKLPLSMLVTDYINNGKTKFNQTASICNWCTKKYQEGYYEGQRFTLKDLIHRSVQYSTNTTAYALK
nr:GW dipeptide domain-containing protein [Atopobacter phocae]